MSTKITVLTAAGLLILSPAALAAADTPAKPSGQSPAVTTGKTAKEDKSSATESKTVMLTGSNLPQKVTKEGKVPDSASPLIVITSEDIEHSGAISVAGALHKMVPAIH